MSVGANEIAREGSMQSGYVLAPGSPVGESARLLAPLFEDAFYTVYSAQSAATGAPIGLTEYYPVSLVARGPNGETLLRSVEAKGLFEFGLNRFAAEAKALAALRHPNLLRYDDAVFDHGTAFAVHDSEEGRSASDLIASFGRPLTQDEIDASLTPLIPALEFLHGEGLVHANITPDSILLRPGPVLIRFGAARSSLAARMGKTGLAVTPGYSAPELHFADDAAHGPLCDVFSLAAVFYYAATGRHPLNVMARSLGDSLAPASALISKDFRRPFLEAIDLGLRLDPERRPQSMRAFGELLLEGVAVKSPAAQPKEPSGLVEGPPHLAMSLAGQALGASKAASEPASSDASLAATAGEGDEFPSMSGNFRGLGLGRMLALAALLLLIVSGGLWGLEAQLKTLPGQQARRNPAAAPLELSPDTPLKTSEVAPAPAGAERPTAPLIAPEPEGAAAAPGAPLSVAIAPALERETDANPQTPQSASLATADVQDSASLAPPLSVATAICGLEERAGESASAAQGADQILNGAGQAFNRLIAEGFLRQSCHIRDLHQQAEHLGEKIKEAEAKRDNAQAELETRPQTPPAVLSPKQDDQALPKPDLAPPERERLVAAVEAQQSLLRSFSEERRRIESEERAAEQTLSERLKERKVFAGPLQAPSAMANRDDAQLAMPPTVAPLASAKKPAALKCSDVLSRLQLGEQSEADLIALKHCELR